MDTQLQMNDIQFDKISQKEVKRLIKTQMKNGISTFEDLQETYIPGEDLSMHKIHVREYFIEGALEAVWNHYLVADPSEVWNGDMISFGLMVSGNSNEIVYPGQKSSGAEAGQVFYVCLNIFAGILKIAVSHKIISVDNDKKIMTLSYVKGGETVGKQDIQLSATKDGKTKITHTTFYKGQPGFREKYLYPFFHTKAINEFHANMKKRFKKA